MLEWETNPIPNSVLDFCLDQVQKLDAKTVLFSLFLLFTVVITLIQDNL
jgi:hypothetical protein